MLKNIGMVELLVILGVLVLFFGGKKIPEFIRSIRETISEYKKGAASDSDSSNSKREDE